jgi:hypothetical protein
MRCAPDSCHSDSRPIARFTDPPETGLLWMTASSQGSARSPRRSTVPASSIALISSCRDILRSPLMRFLIRWSSGWERYTDE